MNNIPLELPAPLMLTLCGIDAWLIWLIVRFFAPIHWVVAGVTFVVLSASYLMSSFATIFWVEPILLFALISVYLAPHEVELVLKVFRRDQEDSRIA